MHAVTGEVLSMAPRRSRCLLVCSLLLCVGLLGPNLRLHAQALFELLSREALPQVPGLGIYTIRDNQRAACYILFVMDGSTSVGRPGDPSVTSSPPASDEPQSPASVSGSESQR